MGKVSVGQLAQNKQHLYAVEIEHMLEEQIRSGFFPEGAQIPTVRRLAEELGANKNTVIRAYKALERKGYLELVRGRGAFVRQRDVAFGELDSRWLMRLDQLLNDAKLLSIDRDQLVECITQRIDRIFGQRQVRIAFVECNAEDIAALGGELSDAVKHTLEGLLLSELLERASEVADQYALIVTTFYHLSEVSQALGEEKRSQVIGVHAMPTHDTLLRIARLHAPVIGLICETASASDTLGHIIQAYHSSATIIPVMLDDKPRLETLLTKADTIVVTRSCYQRLMELQPQVPVIVAEFTLDRQSIDFLQSRIAAVVNVRVEEFG